MVAISSRMSWKHIKFKVNLNCIARPCVKINKRKRRRKKGRMQEKRMENKP